MIVDRDAERRLSVLQFAELLGSVTAACRRCGIDRKTFYTWQQRFSVGGLGALRDRRRSARTI